MTDRPAPFALGVGGCTSNGLRRSRWGWGCVLPATKEPWI